MYHADPAQANPFQPGVNPTQAPALLRQPVPAALEAVAHHQAAHGDALYNASLALHSSLEPQHVLDVILEHAFGFCPQALNARIFLWQKERLSFGAAGWPNHERSRLGVEPPPDSTTYQAARTAQEVFRHRSGPGDAILSLPLKGAERLVAVLTIYFSRNDNFDKESRHLLQLFARQAGIALENALRHDQVIHQAYTDGLTGLPNRRSLDDRLENETRRSSRYQHPFTLMMLDLDGFKSVNDLYGHPAGDSVLQEVAIILRQSLRDSDFFARYGGDEFAIILPETDRETADGMARRLMEVIRGWSEGQNGATGGYIALSLGMASFPEDAITAKGLLSAADRALYEMKSHHRRPG